MVWPEVVTALPTWMEVKPRGRSRCSGGRESQLCECGLSQSNEGGSEKDWTGQGGKHTRPLYMVLAELFVQSAPCGSSAGRLQSFWRGVDCVEEEVSRYGRSTQHSGAGGTYTRAQSCGGDVESPDCQNGDGKRGEIHGLTTRRFGYTSVYAGP